MVFLLLQKSETRLRGVRPVEATALREASKKVALRRRKSLISPSLLRNHKLVKQKLCDVAHSDW